MLYFIYYFVFPPVLAPWYNKQTKNSPVTSVAMRQLSDKQISTTRRTELYDFCVVPAPGVFP